MNEPQPSAWNESLDAQEARLRKELALIKDRWLENKQEDISWVQEAFFNHYNLISLGGLGAITAISAVTPFFPLMAALTCAWEISWLTIASQSERFRRSVRSRRSAQALSERQDKRDKLLASLPETLQARHAAAQAIAHEIRQHAEAAEAGELEVLEETLAKLDYMLEQYARMLLALHQSRQYLKSPEAESLAQRVANLEEELADVPPGRLRTAKEKNLAVLRQRLDRAHKSQEEREYLEVSLDTLENTLKLVRDRVIAATTAQGIASSLDDIILEMGQHRDYMDKVEAEYHTAEDATDWASVAAPSEEERGGRERVV